MSGAFNIQTGLIANNGQLPAIGTMTGSSGGCATVNGIVSRDGGCDTDLKVIIGTGLSYTPAGTAGGTLSNTAAVGATMNGVVSRQGDPTTDAPVLFTNGIDYVPAATAGGLIDIKPTIEANMIGVAGTTGEQFFTDANGLQLKATNAPVDLAPDDAIFKYNNATTNYSWVATGAGGNTNMPIGCMIMYYTNTGFTPDNAGVNGYYMTFGTEIWKLCDGTTGSIPATGSAFGAVPNLINKFARGIDTSAPPAIIPESITISVAPLVEANIPTLNSTDVAFAGKQSGMPNQSAAAGDVQNVLHLHEAWTGEYTWTNPTVANFQLEQLATPGAFTNMTTSTTSGTAWPGTTPDQLELQQHKHEIDITGGTSSCGTAVPVAVLAGGTGIKPTSQDVLYIIRVV